MNDYNKRIENLVNEIKKFKKDVNDLKNENVKLKGENKDLKNKIEIIIIENEKIKKDYKEAKNLNIKYQKKAHSNIKHLQNKLRKSEFLDDRQTSKNLAEKIVRLENIDFKRKNLLLENIFECLGDSLSFDENLIFKLVEYSNNINDDGIQRLIKNIIERNKTADA